LSDGGDDTVANQNVGALRMVVIDDRATPDDPCRHGFLPLMLQP
jgi:hypothetical protein